LSAKIKKYGKRSKMKTAIREDSKATANSSGNAKALSKRNLLTNNFSCGKSLPHFIYADLYLIPNICAGYEDHKALHASDSIPASAPSFYLHGGGVTRLDRRGYGWSSFKASWSVSTSSVHFFNSFLLEVTSSFGLLKLPNVLDILFLAAFFDN